VIQPGDVGVESSGDLASMKCDDGEFVDGIRLSRRLMTFPREVDADFARSGMLNSKGSCNSILGPGETKIFTALKLPRARTKMDPGSGSSSSGIGFFSTKGL
jgi:hypothetical protein